jgi:hypothetical protein
MAFMVMTKRRPGVSREQLIEHLTSKMHPSTWELIRKEKIEQLFFITGDEPGFFAVVNSDDIDEVKAMVHEAISKHNLFDLEIMPINRFPEFSTVLTSEQ